jgi:hypothetical protein
MGAGESDQAAGKRIVFDKLVYLAVLLVLR